MTRLRDATGDNSVRLSLTGRSLGSNSENLTQKFREFDPKIDLIFVRPDKLWLKMSRSVKFKIIACSRSRDEHFKSNQFRSFFFSIIQLKIIVLPRGQCNIVISVDETWSRSNEKCIPISGISIANNLGTWLDIYDCSLSKI